LRQWNGYLLVPLFRNKITVLNIFFEVSFDASTDNVFEPTVIVVCPEAVPSPPSGEGFRERFVRLID
jgi:hypothetical protein